MTVVLNRRSKARLASLPRWKDARSGAKTVDADDPVDGIDGQDADVDPPAAVSLGELGDELSDVPLVDVRLDSPCAVERRAESRRRPVCCRSVSVMGCRSTADPAVQFRAAVAG